MNFDELKKAMADAIAKGDTKAIEEAAAAISKSKVERHKAEAEAIRKESEALAGKREKFGEVIKSAVKGLGLDKDIAALKAKGFTYTIDHREDPNGRINPEGEVKVTGGVGLLVPSVRGKSAGGAGGAGKTKDEFGMSLGEVFEKFATDEERDKLAIAETNSAQWAIKNSVKKRAIKDGLLNPAK